MEKENKKSSIASMSFYCFDKNDLFIIKKQEEKYYNKVKE
jgi:hypothetical protein